MIGPCNGDGVVPVVASTLHLEGSRWRGGVDDLLRARIFKKLIKLSIIVPMP